MLEASFQLQTTPLKREPMGMAAKFFLRYCPWCGRKLNNKE